MISFALIASLAFCSEPPKGRSAEGIVTEVGDASVTLGRAGAFSLTKDTQYLRESGLDPWVVEARDLKKGQAVHLTIANGVVTRVFIKRFVPLAPGEVLMLEVRLGAEDNTEVLMRTMDGFRKKLPEPHGLGEQNGLGVADINGNTHPDSHLNGIAKRLNVKTRAECMALLTYLKDPDPKIRRIAAFAIEGVVKAYPGGMSSEDMQKVDSDGHRKMVQAFIVGIEKLK
jgi:hypothetical protein